MADLNRDHRHRSANPAAIEQRIFDTEEQIRAFKKETSEQVARLGIDTHTQIAELRQDSKVQIMALRKESREDLSAFRGEVKQSLDHIVDKLDIQLTRSADHARVNWSAVLGSFAGLGALLISLFGVIGSLAKAPIDAELVRINGEIRSIHAASVPQSEVRSERESAIERATYLQSQINQLSQTSVRIDAFSEFKESLAQEKLIAQRELDRSNANIQSLRAVPSESVGEKHKLRR